MLASTLVPILITFFTLIYFIFEHKYRYWNRRGVENPAVKIPLGNLGVLLTKTSSFGRLFKDGYREFKQKGSRYFGFYFLVQPVLVIIDLDLIKKIFTSDFQHFTDHGNFIDEEREPLTGHLFALQGQKWRNLRVKVTPTFTSGKMKMMFPTVMDCLKGLIEVMDDSASKDEAINIKDVAARFTIDVIGSCAFGLDCDSLRNPDSEFRKYANAKFKKTFKGLIARTVASTCPRLLRVLNLTFIDKDASNFFMKVVNEIVNYRETNNISRKDFMHLLIQLKNNARLNDEEHTELLTPTNKSTENEKYLTMNELTAQVFVFFIAGFETSSTTLTFCLYELSKNEDIQERLREEVFNMLKNHDGKITYESIMELNYMDKCIYETLRKYPPVPTLIRSCTKEYNVPGSDVIIEKGTKTFIPIYDIQNDPEYYPDPERFDPERFSPENKASRHSFSWLPFGEGPRICIGLRFGMMQTKIALSSLLSKYKFTLSKKTQEPLTMDSPNMVLSTKEDIWLNAEKF